jgi:tRNA (mo5U34)-methyltransferase
MIDYQSLYVQLSEAGLTDWVTELPDQINRILLNGGHGDLQKWQQILEQLPDINPSHIDLNRSRITIGAASDCNESEQHQLITQLQALRPWRKGPYNLFGIAIDTEWRSDLKWDRVQPHITPLKDRLILDVGCGSGYHCWRMEGDGARLVIGIDPTLLFCMQYHTVQRYVQSTKTFVLPFSTDNLPATPAVFDTVFSMGVLYHRRSPIDHLTQLWDWLQWQGELVLETLVIDGAEGQVLIPEQRYAKMRNVWFIPSCDTLALWLRRCNFENIRCVDMNQTTIEEQHSTDWMTFESLSDFLDPNDPNKTIEGYPAPKRATFIANKPAR